MHEESELEEHEALFDYVEEAEYARIVRQRQEEGFILDDGKGERERAWSMKYTIWEGGVLLLVHILLYTYCVS